ncbi:hypothetical protein BJ912DRAFT_449955 [Pholiota molesta]|nr:hypothetical protein BJ912DRAFT_449955 [Pholiota molesta]
MPANLHRACYLATDVEPRSHRHRACASKAAAAAFKQPICSPKTDPHGEPFKRVAAVEGWLPARRLSVAARAGGTPDCRLGGPQAHCRRVEHAPDRRLRYEYESLLAAVEHQHDERKSLLAAVEHQPDERETRVARPQRPRMTYALWQLARRRCRRPIGLACSRRQRGLQPPSRPVAVLSSRRDQSRHRARSQLPSLSNLASSTVDDFSSPRGRGVGMSPPLCRRAPVQQARAPACPSRTWRRRMSARLNPTRSRLLNSKTERGYLLTCITATSLPMSVSIDATCSVSPFSLPCAPPWPSCSKVALEVAANYQAHLAAIERQHKKGGGESGGNGLRHRVEVRVPKL